MCLCVYMCMHVQMCMNVCVHICVCACMLYSNYFDHGTLGAEEAGFAISQHSSGLPVGEAGGWCAGRAMTPRGTQVLAGPRP